MRRISVQIVFAVVMTVSTAGSSPAATVAGGGKSETDCALVLEIPGANKPAPPRAPRSVDCVDGDASCDSDGLRNGECIFPLQLCVNSTAIESCTADIVDSVTIDHAIDDAADRRFDVDFQALQLRVSGLGLPTTQLDRCTLSSSITVRLRGPDSSGKMKINKKTVGVTTQGATAYGAVSDIDKAKFTCRPEGDAIYLPADLYEGTFDRINRQVFTQSCALSGCHDSEGSTNSGNLILLAGSAYGNLVGVTPANNTAAADMLQRVTPGDADASFLYLKLTGNLQPLYGNPMPYGKAALDPELIEIIRLWIVGDGVLGPAPMNGWVAGTDQ